MTDYIIIILLFMIWLQGSRYGKILAGWQANLEHWVRKTYRERKNARH